MIDRKLLHLTLDNIAKADLLTDFAKSLARNGTTPEQVRLALNGRNDQVSRELLERMR